MTAQSLVRSIRSRASLPLVLAIGASLPFACHSAGPDPVATGGSSLAAPPLGATVFFAVLAGTRVTNTGATVLVGGEAGLGVAPGNTIIGFPPGRVGGSTHVDDSPALQGQTDATTAYAALAGASCKLDLTGRDLGGLTLTPGVYCFSSEAPLTGTLVLDAQGDFNALFVFQIGSTLTIGANASVQFVNHADPCQVWWQVGDSATIGARAYAGGNLFVLNNVTIDNGASFSGRVLARNGGVSMDTDAISLPEPAHAGLACSGVRVDAGVDARAVESGGGGVDAGADASAVESGGRGVDAGPDVASTESGRDTGGPDAGGPDTGGADAGSGGDARTTLCWIFLWPLFYLLHGGGS